MNKELDDLTVRQWRALMRRQRALVREYLLAVGRCRSDEVLSEISRLLRSVATDVEVARQFIPKLPPEPY